MITSNQIPAIYQNWLKNAKNTLIDQWGLNSALAEQISVFLLYVTYYNLPYWITSGFRHPKYQAALRKRWDEGDRSGLRYRPALKSKHSEMIDPFTPGAAAIDIASDSDENEDILGGLAPYFGLKWGGLFRTPDKVHYYLDDL